jgi:transposase
MLTMHKIILTHEEKSILELRHKAARDSRECDRIKAILLRSESWTVANISQALRISPSTVTQHIIDYLEKQKLKPENGGSNSYLNAEQSALMIHHISENLYVNSTDIINFIFHKFNVQYSIAGLTKWLHRVGFSYKQPKGVPHKCDLEQQAIFIDHYQSLRDNLPDDEHILFMDAVHPTQSTKLSYGWIRTGHDKAIKTTGSRTRINIVGAIELGQISQAITAQFETINSGAIIPFLEKIREHYQTSGKIHLILDGAGYHRSKEVVAAAHNLNIILHYLPPYSPNLNPIERLWKVMNEKVRNNRYFADAKSFRSTINLFFDEILPNIGHTLNCRINDHFQRPNLAS